MNIKELKRIISLIDDDVEVAFDLGNGDGLYKKLTPVWVSIMTQHGPNHFKEIPVGANVAAYKDPKRVWVLE